MFTYKQSVLFLVLLAGGFAACSSSGNNNTQPTVIGGSTGAAGDMGAGGNGGNIGAGGVVAMDADVGGGGAIAMDAALVVDSPVGVGVDAAPADSAPSGGIDGGPVADAGLLVADSAVAPVVCPTPTKAGNLAIINGPAAAGVIPLDVTGPTPPVYDPATNTCQ
jgi:hypothetical protein